MKKLFIILIPVLFSILICSCNTTDNAAALLIGKWELKSIVFKTVDSSGRVSTNSPLCENNQEVHDYKTDGTFTISYYGDPTPPFNYSISGDQLTRRYETCTFILSGNTLHTSSQINSVTKVVQRWERL